MFILTLLYMLSSALIYTIIVFTVVMAVVYHTKPKFIFDDEGNIKQFGKGDNKSFVPFSVLGIVTAVVIYFACCLLTKGEKKEVVQQMIPYIPQSANQNEFTYRIAKTAPDGTIQLL